MAKPEGWYLARLYISEFFYIMAITRFRKSFQYPDDSDDDSNDEAFRGIDEEGKRPEKLLEHGS